MTFPFSDFIQNKNSTTQIFTGSGAASTFFTWHKPDGCTLLYIICVGGGGGGGTGSLNGISGGSSTTTAAGGGGGGAGAICKLIIPAFMLPDTLFIQPGIGGAGAAGVTGTSSSNTGGSSGSAGTIS